MKLFQYYNISQKQYIFINNEINRYYKLKDAVRKKDQKFINQFLTKKSWLSIVEKKVLTKLVMKYLVIKKKICCIKWEEFKKQNLESTNC